VTAAEDARLWSAAAQRNRAPILAELQRLLPPQGMALEIASGTGEHALHFAAGLPGWRWQASDADPRARASIASHAADAALPNLLLPPLALDVLHGPWPAARFDLVFCANLLHIAPWETCAALMRGAARHLAANGLLLLYGPYVMDGEPTADSNLAFDADLRARDPDWGLRRLADVVEQAQGVGLQWRERVSMPANNLLLVLAHGR
jgi:Protein of unknown function (DUF938)